MSLLSGNVSTNDDPRLGTLVESNRYMLENQESCNVVFRIKTRPRSAVARTGVKNAPHSMRTSRATSSSMPVNPQRRRSLSQLASPRSIPVQSANQRGADAKGLYLPPISSKATSNPSSENRSSAEKYRPTNGVSNSEPFSRGSTDLNGRLHFSPTGMYAGSEYPMAHMFVLRARCPKLAEKAKKLQPFAQTEDMYDVELEDIAPQAFYEVLRFLYYEKTRLTPENCFPILLFSRRYNIPLLSTTADQYILKRINSNTVCEILNNGMKYNDEGLITYCTEYISLNTRQVLQNESFLSASAEVVDLIASLDYLGVSEIDLWDNCITWAKNRAKSEQKSTGLEDQNSQGVEEITGEMLKKELQLILTNKRIRFPTMSLTDFSERVVPLGILENNEMVDVYRYISHSQILEKAKHSLSQVPKAHITQGRGLATITAASKFNCVKRNLTIPKEEAESFARTNTPPHLRSTVYRSLFIRW